MEVSFGFFVILVVIVLPGLIFRRLYFYGEFSKQFMSGFNVAGVLALSVVPGVVLITATAVLYHLFFCNLNLAHAVDMFKRLSSPEILLSDTSENGGDVFNEQVWRFAMPFILLEYLIAVILGAVSGRFVRITRLDTKFKLLRFKNHWFYAFNGQYKGFKKYKHLQKESKNFLFTKADILIDTTDGPRLYSGIVVDYELHENESSSLSKVYLKNAERYSLKAGERIKVDIPGELLVVDCKMLININLIYVFEPKQLADQSKLPEKIDLGFGLVILGLIPFFIFKVEWIDNVKYLAYFDYPWYKKIIAYLLIIQIVSVFNPYLKLNEKHQFITVKVFVAKLVWLIILGLIIWKVL